MIDTLHFYFNINSDKVQDLLSRLDSWKPSGKHRFIGWCRNLRVEIKKYRVRISGSIPKYYLGHNAYALLPQQLEEAFAQLSEELGTSVLSGKISRIDIGFPFCIGMPPVDLLPLFRLCSRYKRNEYPHGVTFWNNSTSIILYDKWVEVIAHDEMLPDSLIGLYIVRCEAQFRKSTKTLTGNSIYVRDLMRPLISDTLIKEFCNRLAAIDMVEQVGDARRVDFYWIVNEAVQQYREALNIKCEFPRQRVLQSIRDGGKR